MKITEKQLNIISYFLSFTAGIKGDGQSVDNLSKLPIMIACDVVKNIMAENYNDALYQLDHYNCLSNQDKKVLREDRNMKI